MADNAPETAPETAIQRIERELAEAPPRSFEYLPASPGSFIELADASLTLIDDILAAMLELVKTDPETARTILDDVTLVKSYDPELIDAALRQAARPEPGGWVTLQRPDQIIVLPVHTIVLRED